MLFPLEDSIAMPRILTIVAPTRNSGKTTAAINLAASLAILDQKTLLMDCDPAQGVWRGASLLAPTGNSGGFYGVMTDRSSLEDALMTTSLPGLDMLPAGADFSRADFLFENTDGDIFKLRDMIFRKTAAYDYVIINGPPPEMPGLLASVLISSPYLMIPLRAEAAAPSELLPWLSGMKSLFSEMAAQEKQWDLSARILGILVNRSRSQEEGPESPEVPIPVLENLREFVFKTRIPESQALAEGFSLGKPAAVYRISSRGAAAFMDLAEEVMGKFG